MGADLIGKLEQIASRPRIQRYRDAARSEFEAATLYCWNIHLAESLMPSLAILEVTLRNSVHDVLTRHVGSEFWFRTVLHPKSYQNIADLMSRSTQRHGRPPTSGKVISEITFGFWPKLFARRYNDLWWAPVSPLLSQVLPHHPNLARDTRKQLEMRLEYFAMLRNRAMHQEAVFQGVAALNRPLVPVETLHLQVLETIGWINQDAASIVSCLDRFDDAYRNGQSRIEAALRHRFDP